MPYLPLPPSDVEDEPGADANVLMDGPAEELPDVPTAGQPHRGPVVQGDVHAGARRDNKPEGRNVPCTIHEPARALGDEVLAEPAVADRGLPEEPCPTRGP